MPHDPSRKPEFRRGESDIRWRWGKECLGRLINKNKLRNSRRGVALCAVRNAASTFSRVAPNPKRWKRRCAPRCLRPDVEIVSHDDHWERAVMSPRCKGTSGTTQSLSAAMCVRPSAIGRADYTPIYLSEIEDPFSKWRHAD